MLVHERAGEYGAVMSCSSLEYGVSGDGGKNRRDSTLLSVPFVKRDWFDEVGERLFELFAHPSNRVEYAAGVIPVDAGESSMRAAGIFALPVSVMSSLNVNPDGIWAISSSAATCQIFRIVGSSRC